MFKAILLLVVFIIGFLPSYRAQSCDDISLDATGDVCGGVFDSFSSYKFYNTSLYTAGIIDFFVLCYLKLVYTMCNSRLSHLSFPTRNFGSFFYQ